MDTLTALLLLRWGWLIDTRGAGMLLGCILLGACANAPEVRAPVTRLPNGFTVPHTLEVAGDLDQWWLLYDDPQLAELEERALAGSFTVREAFARLEEARAVRAGALSRFGIRGDLSGNAKIQREEQLDGDPLRIDVPGLDLGDLGAGSVTRTSAGLALPISWELDLLNRRGAARRIAEADLAASEFLYRGARATVAAEVARSLFQLRGIAARLADAREVAASARRLKDALAVRRERGIAAASEVDRVAADLARAEAESVALSGTLDASRRALLTLIGAGTAPIDTLAITSEVVNPPIVPASIPALLLRRRPDVREAEARMLAAANQVRLAELDFWPRLTLNPSLSLAYSDGSLGGLDAIGAAGAALSAPIFDRARLHSQLGASSARAEQAVLVYERTVQTAFSEADQALTLLTADRERIAALEGGAMAANRSHAAALKRFDLGFADLQEVLDAEQSARGARSALTTARIEALQRSVTAFQALGGGWSSLEVQDD